MLNIIKSSFFFLLLILINKNLVFAQNDCIDSLQIDSFFIKLRCLPYHQFDEYDFNPVCGCDSITYSSPTCAWASGVTQFQFYPCHCIDSSFIDSSKSIIDFILPLSEPNPVRGCDGKIYLTPAMAVYSAGVMSFTKDTIPCIEPRFINPSIGLNAFPDNYVCGCDKKTYRNKFEAIIFGGVTRWSNGKCTCINDYKIDTSVVCPDVYEPVCGCNRITYKNQCVAEHHFGLQYTIPGECPCFDSTLILNDSILFTKVNAGKDHLYRPVCGCDSITYVNSIIAQYLFGITRWTKGVCKCIDSSQIDTLVECYNTYLPVKGCDGKIYHNACIARYHFGIMDYKPLDCYEPLLKDSTYNCYPVFNYDPVCGCDYKTYPNECYAEKYGGISRFYYGECLNDTNCIDTFLINPLKYCLDFYDPVCGCDSITYTNECIAKFKYGVKKWRAGTCTSGLYYADQQPKQTPVLYPNPVTDKLNIFITDNRNFNKMVISDVFGKEVQNLVLPAGILNHTIDISKLSSGIYIVTFIDKSLRYSEKIIKI